jgi:hypothetical protein
MWKRYGPYLTSIIFNAAVLVGITVVGALIYGAITGGPGGDGLFMAPRFFRTASDVLFLEGGIILTFGALVEFLLKAHSYPLARTAMRPYSMAIRMVSPGCVREEPQGHYAGGWMLIFMGALLVAASLAFALAAMK